MLNIQNVKKHIDVKAYYISEGITLKRCTGQGWFQTSALCPFHDDKRPDTFYVNIHTGKFTCYSCGSYGDVIDYHSQKYGLTLYGALKTLEERFNG